jgi:hypothetical protein
MEVLRETEIRLANRPAVKFPENYSTQLFFKENKSFYVHQINEAESSYIKFSEEALEGVEPEVKFIFNASVNEALNFLDPSQVQIRALPQVDKKKALILLTAALGT